MVAIIRSLRGEVSRTSISFPVQAKKLIKFVEWAAIGLTVGYVAYRVWKYLQPGKSTTSLDDRFQEVGRKAQKLEREIQASLLVETSLPAPNQTVSAWLAAKADKLLVDINWAIKGRDFVTYGILNRICREQSNWDLASLFRGSKRTHSIEELVPTSTIINLSSADFFSMVDLISGEQALEILKDKNANGDRKMGFYLYNPHFACVFAERQRQASEVAVDEKTQREADGFFKNAKKCPKDEIAQLQATEKFKALDKLRIEPSGTLEQNEAAQKAWRELNDQYLAEGIQSPITHSILEEINTKLRLDNRLIALENRELGFRKSRMEGSDPDKNIFYLPGRQVEQEMTHFIEWLNQEIEKCDRSQSNPIIVAALAYQKFVSIHPFMDGNGRTGRFIADLVLRRFGFLPAAWGKDFCVAILLTRDNPVTPTQAIEKMLSALKKSYNILGHETTI